MKLSASLALSALAALVIVQPASAQQVISDPGFCAQFYPNANCNNRGPNNPYSGDYQRRGGTSGPLAGYNGDGYNSAYAWDEPEPRSSRRTRR